MIKRYLGNKQEVLGPLMDVVQQHAGEGQHVVDLFSGSLTVSLALKAHGYRVTANDINLLSSIIGQAFLEPSTVPSADTSVIPVAMRDDLRRQAVHTLRDSALNQDFWLSIEAGLHSEVVSLLMLVQWLASVTPADLAPKFRRTDFFDTYCEEGRNAAFISSRGTEGRRRFFSPENATRIDNALSQIREWSQADVLQPAVLAYLLSAVMRATEKVSNTQGTYHDFPRDRWDPRALQPMNLRPLPTDPMLSSVKGHRVGREEDSRTFIKTVDEHAVLYLDPPYNFRQYSAYYFLLNVMCRYPTIPDLDDYFKGVKYVRGQNPEDDFTSTFCKSSRFINDMGHLMESARCETVVVSYYTGRNHWSSFDSGRDDTGLNLLQSLMTGSMFTPGTFEAFEVDRLNYASYGGYKARTVQELILVAKKRGVSGRERSADGGVSEVA